MIPNFTFTTLDASRRDESTGLVDYMVVRKGAGVLLSLFGYNSGAQQFLQLFDRTQGPTVSITDTATINGLITAANHGLFTGDQIIVTGIAGVTTGYVNVLSSSTFTIHATRAEALTGANTIIPDNDDDTGSFTAVPFHTFAIGNADNFSVIVPQTGINFSRGLVAAVSTTGPLYTAGAKEVTLCGTLIA